MGESVPAVVVFHAPGWDPARNDEIEAYRHAAMRAAGIDASPMVSLYPNDSPEAAAYGVSGESAVFVLDAKGTVIWRYVAGVDSLEALPAAVTAEHEPTVTSDPRLFWSRRDFVSTAVTAALAVALAPSFRRASALTPTAPPAPVSSAANSVTLHVNGKDVTLQLDSRVTLLDALREYAGLTGSKKGCDHGQCGACTVHVDGKRVLSCLTLAMMAQGKQVTTIEGLAVGSGDAAQLHPVQKAFIEHDGFQCGYCTSGQIMSAVAVLHEPWGTGDDDVREAMSGNICRCGAYPGIVAAVQSARRTPAGAQ